MGSKKAQMSINTIVGEEHGASTPNSSRGSIGNLERMFKEMRIFAGVLSDFGHLSSSSTTTTATTAC